MVAESLSHRPGSIIRFETMAREFGVCDGEIARVFSASGERLREYRGFCDMEPPEQDRFVIGGGILTYTHPLDTSFSKKDLMFAADFRLAEIRVTGRSCVYSMRPAGHEWPDPELIGKRYDEIRSSKAFVEKVANIKSAPLFQTRSRDMEMDIFRIRRDLICRELADSLGMEYTRSPVTPGHPWLPG